MCGECVRVDVCMCDVHVLGVGASYACVCECPSLSAILYVYVRMYVCAYMSMFALELYFRHLRLQI